MLKLEVLLQYETLDYAAPVAERKYVLRNRTNYQPLSCSGVFTALRRFLSRIQVVSPFKKRLMSSAQCVPKASHCRTARINTLVTKATESQRFAFTQLSNVQIVFNGRKGKVASSLISASKRSLGRNPAGSGCSPKYQFVYHYCLSLSQQRSDLRLQTGSLVTPLDADWVRAAC